MLTTILYATDFSFGSALALPYAFSIAEHYNSKLVLLHVLQETEMPFSFDRAMASIEPLEHLRKLIPRGIDPYV